MKMPYGIQPGQAFSYKDCYGNLAQAFAFCMTLIQSKSAAITVTDSYDTTVASTEVAQGSVINSLRLTTGNADSECGLTENDRFFNEANGAGYADKCSVTILTQYGVSAEFLLNTLAKAVAVNDACLSEIWNANERCHLVKNMMQHYWNKYPVDSFQRQQSEATTEATTRPIVNMGAKSYDDLGNNCWYTFTRRDETLRINVDNLDTDAFAVGDVIQFVATYATLQLVPSLDCVRPLGSVELAQVQAAPPAAPAAA